MAEPREMTKAECREAFLRQVASYVEYWLHESRTPDARGKLEGLAFGIMVILDGASAGLPGFEVRPRPHESDKDYHREQGDDWWPEGTVDIGGSLHDEVHKYFPAGR